MKKAVAVFTLLILFPLVSAAEEGLKVRDALKNVQAVVYPDRGRPVDRTVAEALVQELVPQARVEAVKAPETLSSPSLRIAVADEKFAAGPASTAPDKPDEPGWMFIKLGADGSGELVASRAHLLYPLFCLLKEKWLDSDLGAFAAGKLIRPAFARLEGGDNYLANPKWVAEGYDAETSVRELARLGFSHVPVNALAKDMPAEQGPPGEIYYRFYYFSPDLDQFVETPLNAGAYSPEYLQANLELLKRNARLAVKYGLTPGLNISSPRSVPETILERYPFLRGARVDHPFRSYRPRFTLTLSHPAVRWHYAELMRRLMKEVPELGYIYLWTNDSGSGFEYTASLYAGRNGGAYLVREWKSHEAIARAAAENVTRYFRTLRDAARETNPGFRVLTNLFSFAEEEKFLLDDLDAGVDLWVEPKELDGSARARRLQDLPKRGSWLFTTTRLQNNFLLGIPFPWLARDQVKTLASSGFDKAAVIVDPAPLAPFDINRDVLREMNFDPTADVDALVGGRAQGLVGAKDAPRLIEAWRLFDRAQRGFPDVPLYGNNNWGFPWYRLFVRPFVPDIARIPEAERAYYERFMTVTFNNPNLVDLAVDILWTLMTREQADAIVAQADREVWKPLDEAIAVLTAAEREAATEAGKRIFADQRDRANALRCYFRTLRNTAAWVAGVHGYLETKDPAEKERRRAQVRAMVDDEIRNARELAGLIERSEVTLMPFAKAEETFNLYGRNLPELIRRRIELMAAHRDDEPRIDPDFMWRMPAGFPVEPRTYLRY
ncbi:MAG: hypothetical protein OEW05_12200 [Candidatus Aminicenantes bacterium]|nr:hypothetical protein [Candidatus Aminicenantes bacterium]